MNPCKHKLRLGSLCAHCGETINEEESLFCLLHDTDILKTTEEEAKKIAKERKKKLDEEKKLILIIDLDQTILHASYNPEIEYLFRKNLYTEINIDFEKKRKNKEENVKRVKIMEQIEENVLIKENETVEISLEDLKTENKIQNIFDLEKTKKGQEMQTDIIKEKEIKDSCHTNKLAKNQMHITETDFELRIKEEKISTENISNEKNHIKGEDNFILDGLNKENGDNNNNEIYHEPSKTIYTFHIDNVKYYLKLRPYFRELIRFCEDKFEMHVYTMGNRKYAENIIKIIDPSNIYFQNRIITRDENENLLEKNLNRLSSEHSNIVVLDDRGDVWNFCTNLINIRPYYFFKSGDINAPEKLKNKNYRIEEISTKEKGSDVDLNFTTLLYEKEDKELLFIEKVLLKIYELYFSEEKNVKRIFKNIRTQIFEGLIFYIDRNILFKRKHLKKVIKHCGGRIGKKRVDYIVASDLNLNILEKQEKLKCDIIDFWWIICSNMYFKKIDITRFILKGFVDDDLVKELEHDIFD